ncbi:MAG: S8 family serine peptidase [Bacteroidetes bacterium]|nr:S8 family serine peptidase [Bacteroidota bacterium]
MKSKLLLFLLTLTLPQISLSADYYYYKGSRIQLNQRYDKAAVVFNNDLSDIEAQSILLPLLSSGDALKRSFPDLYLISFSQMRSASEIDLISEKLKYNSNIKFVTPVYYGSSKSVTQIPYDRIIVKLLNSQDREKLDILNLRNGCYISGEFKKGNGFILKSLSGNPKNALDLSEVYFRTGLFEYCEPDFVYPEKCLLLSVPNDQYYPQQWNLNNTGQLIQTGSSFLFYGDRPTVNGIPGSDMHVEQAWDFTTGSPSVKIGVIDSGIDSVHEDFQAPGHLLPGYDAFMNVNSSTVDYFNHGTSTAGIIGAVRNNSIGIAGIAAGCQLMSINIYDVNGNTTSSIIARAFDTARVRGIDVLSNSWGGGTPESIVTDAVNDAALNGRNGLGCVILFASGNDGHNPPLYPSVLPNVLSIGGSTPHDQMKAPGNGNQFYWGANYGENEIGDLDMVAPTNCYALNIGGYEPNFWGTSATCPNAAGVAALVLSVNTSQTRLQVYENLARGCDKPDNVAYDTAKSFGKWNDHYGYGRVNALNSVRLAAGVDVTPPTINHKNVSSGNSTYPTLINAEIIDQDGSSVPVSGSNRPVLFYKKRKNSGLWSSYDSLDFKSNSGNNFTFSIPSQGWETEIKYYIRARDNSGNESTFPLHAPNEFWLCYYSICNIASETKKINPFIGADYGATVSSPVTFGTFNVLETRVKIYMRHTYLDDETITLFSPLLDENNSRKCLFSSNGGDMDNITGTTVYDNAPNIWLNGTPPYLDGSFRPDYFLRGLNGANALGNWKILHFDRALSDYAFFDSVMITLYKNSGVTSSAVRFDKPADSIVSFGTVNFPNQYDVDFYIKNSGTANLSLSSPVFSGTHSSLFSIINTFPGTVLPGDSGLIRIRLDASGLSSVSDGGPFEDAVLSITTNDPSKSNFKVSLQSDNALSGGMKNLKLNALIEGFYNTGSNTMISDSMLVQLRAFNSPYVIVDSKKAVMNDSGKGDFNFSSASDNTPYYVILKHRNSIETWSSAGVSFTASLANYNFTDIISRAYGSNLKQKGSRFTIYSGDVNQDNIIDITDLSLIDNDAYSFTLGYVPSDVNGDGLVDIADLAITDNNALNVITIIRP